MRFRPWMKKLLAAGSAVCFILVVSCDSDGLQPQPVLQTQPLMTAEEARGALVELLRRDSTAFQRAFDADVLAKQPLTGHGEGSYVCGGFLIRVPEARYQITVRYGCIFEYEGTFRFQEGRWVASKPQWTSAALVK